ncbi:MAG: iron ABC transporter permease [Spirochaetales bacterium]|nr:iron ABC transporter permease [Candidatus Physcosoma equi]
MKKTGERITFEGSRSLAFAWAVVCLFLGLCIVFPPFLVLTAPRAEDFQAVFSSGVWKEAARNTLLECLCSTALSVFIGYLYAFAVVKGNIPWKRFFAFIPLLHMVTPPFVGGLSFILLLGRNGFITSTLLGLDVSLYGFWGLLIAQTLCFFPMAYMICRETLSAINGDLEDAAKALGSGRLHTFFHITLPLSFPGILSSFLFIVVSVMSDFGNPMIVAGRFRVLAVEIYTQLTGWANGGRSAVLGLLLVVPSVVLFVLQTRMAKRNYSRTAVIGDHGGITVINKPAKLTTVLLTVFVSFISLCVLSQFLAIIAGSFQRIWGVDTTFTLKHIQYLGKCMKELKNSVTFALYGAVLSTLLAVIASYLVYRTKCPLKKTIDILSQIPAAVPGTLFGLAFSIASSRLHFHQSEVLIVVAITVGFLPFSYRILSSVFSQIKMSLDEVGRSLGATRLQVLRLVLVPIARGGVFSSFTYDFVRGMGTMSAVIFLVSFHTPLASIKILNLAEQGFWGDATALALLLTIITFCVIGIGKIVEWALLEKKSKPLEKKN